MAKDFLIEIGTEELPPKALKGLSEAFANEVRSACDKAELTHGEFQIFAAPRRLALLISDLATEQPSRSIERRGPAVAAAYDDKGKPTKACLGFAASCGVDVAALTTQETDKGAWVVCQVEKIGRSTEELMPELVAQALKRLPIRKPMRWKDHDYEFVRPVHWVVMLYGSDVVPAELFGLQASNQTFGHRFHHPDAITLKNANEYAKALLKTGKVVADFATRQQSVREQVEKIAADKQLTAVITDDLLEEVTNLVEWPVALLGQFDAEFLQVPGEALIAAMRDHQKYFHCVNAAGELQPYFITVSNIESTDPKTVVTGNERVTRARLADAKFFYETDLKQTLESRLPKLAAVTFQAKLGSLNDKTTRLVNLSRTIANTIKADPDATERAALLSKCDLLTHMVSEFPELQGVMGEYYARHDQEPEAVAIALREYYYPRYSGDALPQTLPGCALAVAERLDTLCGIFGIDQAPTGEKDPFGLRRAALGVVRLLIEKQFHCDLSKLIEQAISGFNNSLSNSEAQTQVHDYILDRMRGWYLDQDISAEVFAAVVARQRNDLADFDRRVKAVAEFNKQTAAHALAAANKRVSRILIKEHAELHGNVDAKLLTDPAERELMQALDAKRQQVEPLFAAADYMQGLQILSELQTPIDHFFDQVMVNVEDKNLRTNRLAMLAAIRELFFEVADISLLN